MGVITWRNINAPNFGAANQLIRSGFDDISAGPTHLNKFAEGLQKAAAFEQAQTQQANTEKAVAGILSGDPKAMPAPDALTGGNFGQGLGTVVDAFKNQQNVFRNFTNDGVANKHTEAQTTGLNNENNYFDKGKEVQENVAQSQINFREKSAENSAEANRVSRENNQDNNATKLQVNKNNIAADLAAAKLKAKAAAAAGSGGGSGGSANLNLAVQARIAQWKGANKGKPLTENIIREITNGIVGAARNKTQFDATQYAINTAIKNNAPESVNFDGSDLFGKGHELSDVVKAGSALAQENYGEGKIVTINGTPMVINKAGAKALRSSARKFWIHAANNKKSVSINDLSNHLNKDIQNGILNGVVQPAFNRGDVNSTNNQLLNAARIRQQQKENKKPQKKAPRMRSHN